MARFEFWYICRVHWHRHHLTRPVGVFNSPLYFRLSRNFHRLPDKQFTSCAPKNATGHSHGFIETVLSLIPVCNLFTQPAKMVWVTDENKVFHHLSSQWRNCFAVSFLIFSIANIFFI